MRSNGDEGAPSAALQIGHQLPWSDMRCVAALVRSTLSPKVGAVYRSGLLGSPAAAAAADGTSLLDLDRLCALVVEAFILALQAEDGRGAGQPGALAPPVRVVAMPGAAASDSCVLSGVALDLPLLPAAVGMLPRGPCRIVLFECALDASSAAVGSSKAAAGSAGGFVSRDAVRVELVASQQQQLPQPEGESKVGSSGASRAWSAHGLALRQLLQLADRLAQLGVGVAACQRPIHPALQQALARRGIVPLQRLSAAHATAVAQATGCIPISSHAAPLDLLSRCAGFACSLSRQHLGTKEWLIIRGGSGGGASSNGGAAGISARQPLPVQTLLLGCPHDSAAEELRAAAEASLKVLRWALASPVVLPGGGCAEMLMACHVRQCAAAAAGATAGSGSRRRPACSASAAAHEAFASGLERAAAALVGDAAPHSEATEALRSAAEETRAACACAAEVTAAAAGDSAANESVPFLGWDAATLNIRPVMKAVCRRGGGGGAVAAWHLSSSDAVILDLAAVKMNALATAVEAATAVTRMDGLVAVHS